MDFIRASVKALFYDYPVDSAIEILHSGAPLLINLFPRLVNVRDTTYTQANTEALRKRLCNDWLQSGLILSGCDEMVKALRLPYLYAETLLENDSQNGVAVRFDELFRWNEMARYVGEDVMTISFLAKKDVETEFVRDGFTWCNVLPQNEASLNKALRSSDKGLCDIHLHFGASTDVFQMNWVSLMNNLRGKKEFFDKMAYPLDSPVMVTRRYSFDNLYKWCILAGLIRQELYKYYVNKEQKAFGEQFKTNFENISQKKSLCYGKDIQDIQCLLTDIGKNAVKTRDEKKLDYAITKGTINPAFENSPYMIYHGERYLLYQFYRDYWKETDQCRTIGKYVYLYELIKNQLRRELLQVNDLMGLGNFQDYNGRKTKLVEKGLGLVARKFAVQTTMEEEQDGMEVRIPPMKTAKEYWHLMDAAYQENIFGEKSFTTKDSLQQRMTYVVHFIKTQCKTDNRYAAMRKTLRKQAEILIKGVFEQENKKGIPHRIVGIDAAGGETNTRPEVFAHLYRYCRKCGMKNFTYHVGEDFYDITEGLRSIEEAVRFLQLGEGNRMGHCLALGMNAKRYYEERNGKVIMPRQILLDNLVWLWKQTEGFHLCIPKMIREFLDVKKIKELYQQIGYRYTFNIESYYRSMLLRGDDEKKYDKCCSDWNITALDNSQIAMTARKDEIACGIRDAYFYDKQVYENGFLRSEEFEIPYKYDQLIKKIQDRMIKWIKEKKICIETTPTSNVRIGKLGKYEDLPLYRFAKINKRPDRRVIVSVNTDDKGLFATSLQREFALLALALKKQRIRGNVQRWSDQEIYDYVKHLAEAGSINRFKA